jgi:hypothetical protein
MTDLDQPASSAAKQDAQAASEALESVKRALTSKFKKGERVILYRENKDSVLVAATETDFKLLVKALKIGDKEGLYNLASAEYLFLSANRTRGMVLDTDSLEVEGNYYIILQVRILEGREKGRSGWISEKWVVKE